MKLAALVALFPLFNYAQWRKPIYNEPTLTTAENEKIKWLENIAMQMKLN